MARKDKRGRNLRMGESIRQDGRYQYRYTENGKTKFAYSWRLEVQQKTLADIEEERGVLLKFEA